MTERAREQCDVVMKGGITSGVVYPEAIIELGRRYDLRNLGGSSAGAIAAAVAAAAEYGRQTGVAEDLTRIRGVVNDLTEPEFLLGLFQPTPAMRPLWQILLATRKPAARHAAASAATDATAADSGRAPEPRPAPAPESRRQRADRARERRGRVRGALRALGRARQGTVLGGMTISVLLLAGAGLAIAFLEPVAAVLACVLAAVLAVAVATAALGWAAWEVLRDASRQLEPNGYGFCPGTKQEGSAGPALMEWLHAHIQRCAGLPAERPLTFGMLEDKQVALEMLTTDLNLARPLRCRQDLGGYGFKAPELCRVLPEDAVRQMIAAAEGKDITAVAPADLRSPQLRVVGPDALPALPVLAGVRLSLSFPGIFSAVPLYRGAQRHLFSDGGIASNFPIHFFDALFPSRPTFGLDLAEIPEAGGELVVLPADPSVPAVPRWSSVTSVGDFALRIKDTMQNWRDTTQAELPGYRERICQIRLLRGQGGLNLDMDPDVVARLLDRGRLAGCRLREEFSFAEHRWVRYITGMRLLQAVLQDVDGKFGGFAGDLAAGVPEARSFREAYPADWCAAAGDATRALLDVASEWGRPAQLTFDSEGGPMPRAALRVAPES